MYNAGVQPLQYRGQPMWHFNGEDDANHCGRKGPDSAAALAKILSDLYKGEEEEFIRIKPQDGFSMYNPPGWVSRYILFQSFSRSLACRSVFRGAVSLACLVKAEIVSPYHGILINTGMGNPIVPMV